MARHTQAQGHIEPAGITKIRKSYTSIVGTIIAGTKQTQLSGIAAQILCLRRRILRPILIGQKVF